MNLNADTTKLKISQVVPRVERYNRLDIRVTPNYSLRQTHVARQIVQDLGSIPAVIILSQVRSRRQT